MNASRGRPRHFDPDQVLDAATRVFWACGYEGTSVNQLVEATGLNKPSLYAAFGDKEALYLAVVARYADGLERIQRELLETEPDAWRALEGLMRHSAAVLTDSDFPGGCLVVTGIADCGTPNLPEAAERALRDALARTTASISDRVARGVRDGQIPSSIGADALSEAVATVLAGLAIRAKSGADRIALDRAVDAFVAPWPRPAR